MYSTIITSFVEKEKIGASMGEEKNPFIEQLIKEIEKLFKRFSDTEHQLVQKDIQIATLEFELAIQKKFYALLRESYLKIIRMKNQ